MTRFADCVTGNRQLRGAQRSFADAAIEMASNVGLRADRSRDRSPLTGVVTARSTSPNGTDTPEEPHIATVDEGEGGS